jgi:hypothetical protein
MRGIIVKSRVCAYREAYSSAPAQNGRGWKATRSSAGARRFFWETIKHTVLLKRFETSLFMDTGTMT